MAPSYSDFWGEIRYAVSRESRRIKPETRDFIIMTNTSSRSELLKDAQQAYRQFQIIRGEFMPEWEELTPDTREKWVKAVKPAVEIERQRIIGAGLKSFDNLLTDYGDVMDDLKKA